VHLHILCRRPGDFQRNDDIYDELEKPSKAVASEAISVKIQSNKSSSSQSIAATPHSHVHIDDPTAKIQQNKPLSPSHKYRGFPSMQAEASQYREWMKSF